MINEKDKRPEGMTPIESGGEIEKDTFEQLKETAEAVADDYNVPLCYTFNRDADGESFELVFFLPRKLRTFSLITEQFHRPEVEEWLNDFLARRIRRWFGWSTTPEVPSTGRRMARIAALHTPVYRYAHAQYPQVEYASEAELQATYGPLRAADIIGYEYCANCDRGIIGTKTDDDDLEHNYPCYTARIVQGG